VPIVDLRSFEATAHPWDVLFQLGFTQPKYVDHLGLFSDDEACVGVTSKRYLAMAHVQPCFTESHESSHFLGKAELSQEECEDVATFVEGVRKEKDGLRDLAKLIGEENARNRLFRLYPCYSIATDDFAFRRFSCVGFVIMAYDAIDITLLASRLPEIIYDDLLKVESDDLARIRDATTRQYLGVIDDGPMEFVFPGYVLHAMDRSTGEIRDTPYSPRRGDEFYPSEANTTA